jgi:hypothetical protein
MSRRSPPAIAWFAAAFGCYLSHAGTEDASVDRADAARDGDAGAEAGLEADEAAPPDDGATVCPGDDVIGASELIARRAEFDGRVVRVRGVVAEYGPRRCTGISCAPDSPCCNTCSIPVQLAGADGSGPVIGGTGAAEPGCYGDDCHVACVPYDVGRAYVLRGTFALVPSPPGAVLAVPGGPGDVCEESPPPDHRGAYRVWAKSSELDGECDRWRPVVGGSGHVFVSVGDPGVLEMWQSLAPPPGPGRFEGAILASGSRAEASARIDWSCCTHTLGGVFPDSRAIEVTLTVHETGRPSCDGTFELVGMREDVPCTDEYGAEECARAGGIYGFVGPDTGEICSCPTFDGHETCRSDADCEGACMAEFPPSGSCTGITTGSCTTGHRWSGCWCWLETGPTDYGTCWD